MNSSPSRCPCRFHLTRNWQCEGGTYAIGQADYRGRALDARAIASLLDEVADDQSWIQTVSALNGCFAAVAINVHGSVRAAVDRVRTIPVFFRRVSAEFLLSDDAEWLAARQPRPSINHEALQEFRLTGFVTGDETLLSGLHQLRAGECLLGSHDQIRLHRYFEFRHTDSTEDRLAALMDKLEAAYVEAFTNLLASGDGRPLLVPLSGGFDSRLVAVGLKAAGARNVLCFSYGIAGNWEAQIAKALAGHLGFRWVFLPMSASRWRECAVLPSWSAYTRYAGQLVSVPHLQDWPAIEQLVRERQVEPGSIVVPGHTGDFISGGHIPLSFASVSQVSRSMFFDAIFRKHYSLWDWSEEDTAQRSRFEARIEKVVGPLTSAAPALAADTFERWEWQERQAKFICNSLRTYEFFGLQYRLPHYDHAVMDFWATIPMSVRLNRALYTRYFDECIRLPLKRPNTDHPRWKQLLIDVAGHVGLLGLARASRRRVRRLRWKKEHENCAYPPLAWFGGIDLATFRRHYTGRETLHAFVARDYSEQVVARFGGGEGNPTGSETAVALRN